MNHLVSLNLFSTGVDAFFTHSSDRYHVCHIVPLRPLCPATFFSQRATQQRGFALVCSVSLQQILPITQPPSDRKHVICRCHLSPASGNPPCLTWLSVLQNKRTKQPLPTHLLPKRVFLNWEATHLWALGVYIRATNVDMDLQNPTAHIEQSLSRPSQLYLKTFEQYGCRSIILQSFYRPPQTYLCYFYLLLRLRTANVFAVWSQPPYGQTYR